MAGACCIVKPTVSSIAPGNTININSTGQKNIYHKTHSGSADQYTISAIEKNALGFLMYDGSAYYPAQVIAYFDD